MDCKEFRRLMDKAYGSTSREISYVLYSWCEKFTEDQLRRLIAILFGAIAKEEAIAGDDGRFNCNAFMEKMQKFESEIKAEIEV